MSALILIPIYIVGALVTAIVMRIVERFNPPPPKKESSEYPGLSQDWDDEDDSFLGMIAMWPLVLSIGIIMGGGYGFIKGCEYLAKKIIPDKIRVEEEEKICYTPEDLEEVDKFLEDNAQP